MLEFYEIIVIIASIIMATNSVKNNLKTNRAIYIIHLLFFFVFVLPLLLDYAIGYPSYSGRLYGFSMSYNDTPTRYLYATYLLVSQCIMLIVGNSKLIFNKCNINSNQKVKKCINKKLLSFSNENNKYVDFVLFCASFITVALVLVFPMGKDILWNFGWRDLGVVIEGQKYYSTVEKLSYISVVSALIYLFSKKSRISIKIIFIALIYMSISVQAKRSIIFFVGVVILAYLLFNSNMNKKKWIYILGIISIIGVLYYSIYVKMNLRGYAGFENVYTTLRIDFFRDDTVKMVIYSLLNPNIINILEYPGQSIIMQIGSLFPLPFLGVPSIGYNYYLTSSLIGVSLDNNINWMTTSIFDEMLSNFGFFGFWIAPTVLSIFARIADKQSTKLIPITISVVMLLLMYSPSYIMWFIQFWLFIVIIERKFRVKKRNSINIKNKRLF